MTTTQTEAQAPAPPIPAFIRNVTSMLGTAPSFGAHRFVTKFCIVPVDDSTRSLLKNPKFEGHFEPVDAEAIASMRFCQPCAVFFDSPHVEARHLAAHAEQERGSKALTTLRNLEAQDAADKQSIATAKAAIRDRRPARAEALAAVLASGISVAVIVDPNAPPEQLLPTATDDAIVEETDDADDEPAFPF